MATHMHTLTHILGRALDTFSIWQWAHTAALLLSLPHLLLSPPCFLNPEKDNKVNKDSLKKD